jgi:hypothetical protein
MPQRAAVAFITNGQQVSCQTKSATNPGPSAHGTAVTGQEIAAVAAGFADSCFDAFS